MAPAFHRDCRFYPSVGCLGGKPRGEPAPHTPLVGSPSIPQPQDFGSARPRPSELWVSLHSPRNAQTNLFSLLALLIVKGNKEQTGFGYAGFRGIIFCICSLILRHDAQNHGKHSIDEILDNFSSCLHSSWEKYLPTPPHFACAEVSLHLLYLLLIFC